MSSRLFLRCTQVQPSRIIHSKRRGKSKTAPELAGDHIYLAGRLTRFNKDQEIRGEPTMIVLYHAMQRENASDRGAGTGPEGSRPRSDGAERAIDQERSSVLRGVP